MTRRLTDQDRRVWAKVTRTIRAAPGRLSPLAPDDPAGPPSSPSSSSPALSLPGRRAPPRRSPSSDAPPPADVSAQRRVRRGQLGIDARIDLHGFTQDAAKTALTAFLVREHGAGSRCVLVITGKGRAGAGVLRARLQDWLGDAAVRPLIAGQARAHLRHGGDGAVYVLLKAKRD